MTVFPNFDNIMDVYDIIKTPEEKNILLKTVLSKVVYLKTKKAINRKGDETNFMIEIYPKIICD